MSLETAVTRAWQRQAAWLWLLLPISWLYGLVTMLRRQAYKVGLFSSYRAPIPVMVIGNITVGGSGKTPLIMALVSHLQQHGVQVGVISRGYGGDSRQMPALVTSASLPSVVGDVVDAARGFGSKQLLPTGFLREPMSRLKNATVIYHEKPNTTVIPNNNEQSSKRLTMQLQPDTLLPLLPEFQVNNTLLPIPVGSQVHAVSGIGYPQRFFDTLSTLGFAIIEHPYPDHYDFNVPELLQYTQHPIIVTSKDAVKIRALFLQAESRQKLSIDEQELASRLWVLPVTAILSEPCYQTLEQQLIALNIERDAVNSL